MFTFQQNLQNLGRNKSRWPIHRKKEKKLIEIIPEEAQTWDLINKDFKLAPLNVLKELKETNDKELKEIRKIYEKVENISKKKL